MEANELQEFLHSWKNLLPYMRSFVDVVCFHKESDQQINPIEGEKHQRLSCVINIHLAALVTGGKDSTLALYRILKRGHKVKNLVTMIPQREDSWMFHFPNIHLTDFLAEAVGIPLIRGKTVGIKEMELEDLKKLLSNLRVDGVVHGATSSRYQKERIDRVCRELNLRAIAPLWQEDPIKLLKEIIDLNFQTIIMGVYAHGFNPSWLGRKINLETLDDLIELNKRYQISPVGEGGEYETLVLDAPFFRKKIRLLRTERIWENHSGCLLVKEAKLVDKTSNST